jgi:hypothetical protein
VHEQSEEGWFTDPYALHEARWLSDGVPTKLVRDGEVESYDEPPEGPEVVTPVRLEADPTSQDGADLLRADAAEQGDYDSSVATMGVPWTPSVSRVRPMWSDCTTVRSTRDRAAGCLGGARRQAS